MMANERPCPDCKGRGFTQTGKPFYERIRCPTCKGSGRVRLQPVPRPRLANRDVWQSQLDTQAAEEAPDDKNDPPQATGL